MFHAGRLNVAGFNTTKAINLQGMFYNCTRLDSLDLTSFDTGSATDMQYMFAGCANITRLDLSSFTMPKTNYINRMFQNCYKVEEIKFPKTLNSNSLTQMQYVFYNCYELKSVNMDAFTVNQVSTMLGMFRECRSIEKIDLYNWTIRSRSGSSYVDVREMFYMCWSLTTIYVGSGWNISYIGTASSNQGYNYVSDMFAGCTNLAGAYAISNPTTATYMYNSNPGNRAYGNYAQLGTTGYLSPKMLTNSSVYWSLDGTGELILEPAIGTYGELASCTSQTGQPWNSYIANIKAFSVQNGTVGVVRNGGIAGMFNGMNRLESVNLSGFDTVNATSMAYMFNGCSSLKELDVADLVTSNVTNMAYMFNGCSQLKSLNIKSFDTYKVSSMAYMFNGCSQLTSLDLSTFNTATVNNMSYMFYGCTLMSNLNISTFNVSAVSNMTSMFQNCLYLRTLDFANWSLSPTAASVTTTNMFSGDLRLTTVYVGSNWNKSSIGTSTNMFNGCVAIFGGRPYDPEHLDAFYAEGGAYLSEADVTITLNYINYTTSPGVPGSKIVAPLASPLSFPEPTREGYVFQGWYTSKACDDGTQVRLDSDGKYRPPASGILWAKWELTTYTISYDLGEGATNAETNVNDTETGTFVYSVGTPALRLAEPTNPGYTFVGWTYKNTSNGTTEITGLNTTTPTISFLQNATWGNAYPYRQLDAQPKHAHIVRQPVRRIRADQRAYGPRVLLGRPRLCEDSGLDRTDCRGRRAC